MGSGSGILMLGIDGMYYLILISGILGSLGNEGTFNH